MDDSFEDYLRCLEPLIQKYNVSFELAVSALEAYLNSLASPKSDTLEDIQNRIHEIKTFSMKREKKNLFDFVEAFLKNNSQQPRRSARLSAKKK